jgi:hypothetical protein
MAGALVPAVNTVLQGLLNAAPFASALAITLWGAATLRTGKLPKSLSYVVIIAGLVRLVSYLLPLPILNLVQLALSIVWSVWLGAVLLRPEAAPSAFNARAHSL